MKSRIMFIGPGGGQACGGGRIGRVAFSQTGRSIRYRGITFQTLGGAGYKANYYNVATGAWYWISGPRRDGNDALYPMTIEIDDDVREEYWSEIRKRPDLANCRSYRSGGRHSRRRPRPELSVSGGTKNGGNRGGLGVKRQRVVPR